MIILIGGAKGGTGKTTAAANLGVALASANYDVGMIDADARPSLAKWYQRRSLTETDLLGRLVVERTTENIARSIASMNQEFDFTIIDCGGMDSSEQRQAMAYAHIAIFPVKPSQLDVDSIPEVISMIHDMKIANKGLLSYWLLSDCNTQTNAETYEAREILDEMQGKDLFRLSSATYSRVAYRRSIRLGKGVFEFTDEAAITEINKLCEQVLTIRKGMLNDD